MTMATTALAPVGTARGTCVACRHWLPECPADLKPAGPRQSAWGFCELPRVGRHEVRIIRGAHRATGGGPGPAAEQVQGHLTAHSASCNCFEQ